MMEPPQPCSATFSYQGEFHSVTFASPLQVVIGCYQITPQLSLPQPTTADVQDPVTQTLEHLNSIELNYVLFLMITLKYKRKQCSISRFTSTLWRWVVTILTCQLSVLVYLQSVHTVSLHSAQCLSLPQVLYSRAVAQPLTSHWQSCPAHLIESQKILTVFQPLVSPTCWRISHYPYFGIIYKDTIVSHHPDRIRYQTT